MCKLPNIIVLVLSLSLLANTLAWAFHGEVFAHELDRHNLTHSAAQTMQEDHLTNELSDEKNLDLSAHICLSAAYQPFFFTKFPLLVSIAGKEISAKLILSQVPESFIDSPFRPPRKIIHS